MYNHSSGCWVYRFFICGRCLTTTYGWRISVWKFSWGFWRYRGRSNFNWPINKYFFDDFNWPIDEYFFNNFYGLFYYDFFDDFNWSINKYFFDYFFRGLRKKLTNFFFRFSAVALTASSSRCSVAFFVCSSAIC